MKRLVGINNRIIVLHLNVSDTWPLLWFYKERGERRAYQIAGVGVTVHENGLDWAISIVLLPFSLIFGFPMFCKQTARD